MPPPQNGRDCIGGCLGDRYRNSSAPLVCKVPRQHSSSPDEGQLVEHGHYVNKQGHDIHSPAHTKDGKAPNGATAKCRDRSYSFSEWICPRTSGHRLTLELMIPSCA
ncbi:DUF3761 domain-containing protein [Ralstonia solanacearum]|uniref:DUF3761 domain-containing protein n=1 Tax=Ralstonia solanacearum TaxID=305 RepID=UPI002E1DB095